MELNNHNFFRPVLPNNLAFHKVLTNHYEKRIQNINWGFRNKLAKHKGINILKSNYLFNEYHDYSYISFDELNEAIEMKYSPVLIIFLKENYLNSAKKISKSIIEPFNAKKLKINGFYYAPFKDELIIVLMVNYYGCVKVDIIDKVILNKNNKYILDNNFFVFKNLVFCFEDSYYSMISSENKFLARFPEIIDEEFTEIFLGNEFFGEIKDSSMDIKITNFSYNQNLKKINKEVIFEKLVFNFMEVISQS